MKLKKLTAFILAGALMAAHVASVSAENTEVLDGVIEHDLGVQAEGEYGIMLIDESESLPVEEGASYVNISGKITEITKTEEGIVESILVEKGENDEVALMISEETVAIDSEGMPIDLATLEVGALIDATQSMAQTMSLPPQSQAIAIVLKAEDKVSPKYMEIKTISEVDGKTSFESEDGNYLIAIDENTEFVPFKTRNIVTAADLKADSKVLVWYEISTKSIPEQATAKKVMILPVTIEQEEAEEVIEKQAMYVNISGKITEVTKTEEGIVESVLVEKGENDEVALMISEETVAIDSEGMPIDLTTLEVGALIDATQSMAQTMSLPPQSQAIAIVLKAEDKVSPKYMEIKTISEVDGKTAFESLDGNYLIAIDENTEFIPYKTRNIVTAADLKADSKVLVWYGPSTKSIPEKAVAQKVMILASPQKEAVVNGVEIFGKAVDFTEYDNVLPIVENGIAYLPIRAIAETLWGTVTWDGTTQTVGIKAGYVKVELKIGSEKAVVDGEEVTLVAAPKIVDGRTVIGVSVEDLDKYGMKLITE